VSRYGFVQHSVSEDSGQATIFAFTPMSSLQHKAPVARRARYGAFSLVTMLIIIASSFRHH
jgi:hypothetical protein